MNKRTRIDTENTTKYDFYTVLITCQSIEAIQSLESYLIANGLYSEGCGTDGFEGFIASKDDYNNKAHFIKDVRKMVAKWKKLDD